MKDTRMRLRRPVWAVALWGSMSGAGCLIALLLAMRKLFDVPEDAFTISFALFMLAVVIFWLSGRVVLGTEELCAGNRLFPQRVRRDALRSVSNGRVTWSRGTVVGLHLETIEGTVELRLSANLGPKRRAAWITAIEHWLDETVR